MAGTTADALTTLHYPERPRWRAHSTCVTEDARSAGRRVWRLLRGSRSRVPVNRRTGLVVPPRDVAALAETINWAPDGAKTTEVRAIREAARRTVRELFGPDHYVDDLLRRADELRSERSRRQTDRRSAAT